MGGDHWVRLIVNRGRPGDGQLHQIIYERQNKEGKIALSHLCQIQLEQWPVLIRTRPLSSQLVFII